MWKVAIKYSVLAGVFESVLFHVSRSFAVHPLIDLSHLFFDIIILAIFITIASIEFKRYRNNGYLYFWQGMSIGFLVYTPAIIVFGLFLLVYFDEGLLIEYRQLALLLIENQKDLYIDQFGQEQYDLQCEEIRNIGKNSLIQSSIIKKLIAGFFVTPVISIVLRKKPN